MDARDVPDDIRGPRMPALAASITSNSEKTLDSKAIGCGVQRLHKKYNLDHDRTSYDEALQNLKLLWHVLVRCGVPVRNLKSV